jgi:hypothetical protein
MMTGLTRPHMGSGDDPAAITAAGLAAEVAWALLITAALVPAAAPLSLAADIRRGRERRRQDVLIGKLWAAVQRIPAGSVLADPIAGSLVSAERDGGFLILAITDPPGHPEAEAVVARYMLGFWAVREHPPLHRHLAGVHDASPARMGWNQRERLAEFNASTSALEVTTEELAGLLDQVTRTTSVHLH